MSNVQPRQETTSKPAGPGTPTTPTGEAGSKETGTAENNTDSDNKNATDKPDEKDIVLGDISGNGGFKDLTPTGPGHVFLDNQSLTFVVEVPPSYTLIGATVVVAWEDGGGTDDVTWVAPGEFEAHAKGEPTPNSLLTIPLSYSTARFGLTVSKIPLLPPPRPLNTA